MAIGDDNQAPRDLPDLPEVSGLGGVASAPSARSPAAAGVVHRDSDAPSDSQGPPSEPPSSIDTFLGRTIGGYHLVEKIGQGGMGVVYKGRQVSLDRVVAVKILSKQLYDNEEFIKRFEREAKAVARINHPNIVAVYDFGQHDGLWFMVTEFVEGSSLSRLIAEKVMLDPKELAPLMIDCLAGLAHVGQSGIVHRDIKPDNILITRAGMAKIADFGLAKDVSGTKDHTDLTAVGLAMGTPAYMSPEQCMGRRLDVRSDIYALGVTAYYALAGEKPFVGHSSFEIMTKQRELSPPPPNQLNPRIPKECSDLVMRMLAKNPQDRFPDGESCRLAWAEIRELLQSRRAAMRTGEWEVGSQPVTSNMVKSGRMSVPLPAPPTVATMASPVPIPLPPPQMPMPMAQTDLPPLPQAPVPQGMNETSRTRRSTENVSTPPPPESSAPATDGHGRPITERRLRQQSDAITCSRCGMLNRAELAQCSKCGNPLKEIAPDVAARQQEAEATKLIEQKRFGEAALVYARLADKEVDRRQRSILRSKEREIRKQDIELQVADVMARSKAMVERNDLKGAIEALEQTRSRVSGDAASSTSGSELAVSRELAVLRARLSARKRLAGIGIMVVVLLVIVVLVALHLHAHSARVGLAGRPGAPLALGSTSATRGSVLMEASS
jgi:serine/threonine protein kinase